MEIKVELIEQKEENTLSLRKMAGMADLYQTISDGFAKLYDYIIKIGAEISAAPYVTYLSENRESLTWDIEIGFPVLNETPGTGEIYPGKIYGGRAASTMHKGKYSDLDTVYRTVFKWIEENHLESAGACYDYYLNDPSITPEDELLTQVVVFVK